MEYKGRQGEVGSRGKRERKRERSWAKVLVIRKRSRKWSREGWIIRNREMEDRRKAGRG
jgi:hypothetical protein